MKKLSNSFLLKENRKLKKIQDFIHRQMLYSIPRDVLTDIACEAYQGKISADQFLGACRFMDYYEKEFKKLGEQWKKYVIKDTDTDWFFSNWARSIDAPTTWTMERLKVEREKKNKEVIDEIKARFT